MLIRQGVILTINRGTEVYIANHGETRITIKYQSALSCVSLNLYYTFSLALSICHSLSLSLPHYQYVSIIIISMSLLLSSVCLYYDYQYVSVIIISMSLLLPTLSLNSKISISRIVTLSFSQQHTLFNLSLFLTTSVTRSGDLLDFRQLLKAFGNV